jgi:hypothetical protein
MVIFFTIFSPGKESLKEKQYTFSKKNVRDKIFIKIIFDIRHQISHS